MNSRERFLSALNGGTPDRVPIAEYIFSLKLQKEILGFQTDLYDGPAQTQLAAELGVVMIWAPVNGFCRVDDISQKQNELCQDEWGVTYKKNWWSIISQVNVPKNTHDDWQNYKMRIAKIPGRTIIIGDAVKPNESNLVFVGGIFGPFTMMSWHLIDFEGLSIALLLDPDLVYEIVDTFIEEVKKIGKYPFNI